MTIIPQRIKILHILIAAVFCLILAMPAGVLGNPAGSISTGAVIDQPVYSSQGQELGELEDLVIKRNGSVKKVLISLGGYLEVEDKLVFAKYKAVDFAGGKIILDATQKQLDNQPEFDYRKNGLFTYYHYRLYPHGMMPGPYDPYGSTMPPGYHQPWSDESSRLPEGDSQRYGDENQLEDRPNVYHRGGGMHRMRDGYNPWDWAFYPARMLASVILGQAVVNKQGEDVATVEDLIISTAGRVDQLILSYGGFLDFGDKLVAVPYRSIGFTNRGITYDITRRELENLPKIKGME